jgi:hypothetical protein
LLPQVVQGKSVTRKWAQVGVGRVVGSIAASRIGGIRNATYRLARSGPPALFEKLLPISKQDNTNLVNRVRASSNKRHNGFADALIVEPSGVNGPII